tara:strand:- start:328 stop:474 length:147 start_codon:yes stop_codon:yes gene_type:complete
MIKTTITIKGIEYTIRATTQQGIDDAIKDLKKLNKKTTKKDKDQDDIH